eukprot:jgi/Botrbrau1/7415/Bobra.0112s0015.1
MGKVLHSIAETAGPIAGPVVIIVLWIGKSYIILPIFHVFVRFLRSTPKYQIIQRIGSKRSRFRFWRAKAEVRKYSPFSIAAVIVRTQTLGGAVKAAQTVLANYTRGYKNLKPGTQEQKDEDARARKGSWVALTCAVVISTNEDTLKTMSEVPKPSTIERWRSWWQKLRSGRRKEPSAAAPVQDNGVGSSVVPRDVSGGSVTQEPDEIVSDEGEARVPAPAGTPGSQSVSIELPGMTYTSESITYEVQDPTGPEADARIVISKSTTAIKQPSRTPGADSVQHRTADGTASGTDEVIGQDSESLHTFQVSFILPREAAA